MFNPAVSLARKPNIGLIDVLDIFILAGRDQITALVDRYRPRRPCAYRLFPASGGPMSCGTDLSICFAARRPASTAASRARSRPTSRCRRQARIGDQPQDLAEAFGRGPPLSGRQCRRPAA
jgi:hypothetical protein